MAYNTSHTRRKSSYLHDLDCRTTGATRTAIGGGPPYSGAFVADEIIEAGECIAMVRVPRGFTVTNVKLFHTANAAIVGVGDPFCCGRFIGPVETSNASGAYFQHAERVSCGVAVLQKIGRSGDGCGFGYTYTCETDIIVTNGYGLNSFNQGGSNNPSTTNGGGTAGPLASGTTIWLRVDGHINPAFTNQ